jgi:hypothetical protein
LSFSTRLRCNAKERSKGDTLPHEAAEEISTILVEEAAN